MNRRGKKLEPKLALDMSFGELLGRLVQADPKEVEESVKRSKQRRPETHSKTRGPAKRRPRRPKLKTR